MKSALGRVSSPAILVGHSYGGTLITAAGTDPRVAGLVYIAALAPDANETSQSQLNQFPTNVMRASVPPALSRREISTFGGDASSDTRAALGLVAPERVIEHERAGATKRMSAARKAEAVQFTPRSMLEGCQAEEFAKPIDDNYAIISICKTINLHDFSMKNLAKSLVSLILSP